MARLYRKKTAALLAAVLLLCTLLLPATAETVLLGDLDTDGQITAADARLALRLAVDLMPCTEDYIAVADADGDCSVTAEDARLILRAAVGLEDFEGRTVEAVLDPYAEAASRLNTEIPPAPELHPDHGTFTFVVYGYGHCVGLSQWGAILMGEAGYPYDYILDYYFPGCELITNSSYPSTTYYAGSWVDTYELVTRIVKQEIGGASVHPEALKAQAVAVITLLEYFDYHVSVKSNVGYAVSSFSGCSDTIKNAVREVMGQYLIRAGDEKKEPVLTVYGAMVAGRTLSAKEVWGYADFPVSVSSPFDASAPGFASVKTYTVSEMRSKISSYLGGVNLSADPADWIEILEHDAALDEDRGYVTKVRVGDRVITGLNGLTNTLYLSLRSPCYTVTYTP